MPSKSPAQKRLMAAVAHDPSFAAKVGVPVSVGKEFFAADQRAKRRGVIGKAVRKQRDGHQSRS